MKAEPEKFCPRCGLPEKLCKCKQIERNASYHCDCPCCTFWKMKWRKANPPSSDPRDFVGAGDDW